ncbi:MAG: hypothetical protein ACK4IK_06895 [Bacteroidia bacterium]
MHDIEPHYSWRHLYIASEDERSPFYGREYSEFEFTHAVYNYLIHPQWDDFGSQTLFMKILYADYKEGFAIFEMIGEWNDCLNNDIMFLKRDIVDTMLHHGINKYIIIGENVLNFHASDDSYYEEWFEDVEDGWITFLNFRPHVIMEFKQYGIDYFINMGGKFENMNWSSLSPIQLFQSIQSEINKRLNYYK